MKERKTPHENLMNQAEYEPEFFHLDYVIYFCDSATSFSFNFSNIAKKDWRNS